MPVPASKSKVYFFFDGVKFYFPERTRLKKFIENIFKTEGIKLGSVNYVFTTDKKVLEVNRRFLDHDFYTDIITFDLSEPNSPLQAEIYISVDRVRDNAKTLGVSFQNELVRVLVHGPLHLCGYGDKKPKEVAKMRERETFWISKYK